LFEKSLNFYSVLFILTAIICRTVVRQFLYYGVRVPTTQNNKNSEADKYLLRYFGTLEGTRTPDLLVRSQSLYPAELPARICVALFVL
jgi:hypothetical protein